MKSPWPSAVIGARDHPGVNVAPPTGCPESVATTWPEIDHVSVGVVGAGVVVVGGFDDVGLVGELEPPHAVTVATAKTPAAELSSLMRRAR
jgi:hypothetical protein